MNDTKNEIEETILNKINLVLKEKFGPDKKFEKITGVIDDSGAKWNPLFFVFDYPETKLYKDEIDYLIKNSDLSWVNQTGASALVMAFIHADENNYMLNEEQYQLLIEKTPTRKYNPSLNCDLIMMIMAEQNCIARWGSGKTKFSERNWATIIKKTEKDYFNDEGFLLTSHLISDLLDIGISNTCWDEILKKFDFNNPTYTQLNFNTIYKLLEKGRFDLVLKIAETTSTEILMRFLKISEAGKDPKNSKISDDLKTITDIISTKEDIKKIGEDNKARIKAKI